MTWAEQQVFVPGENGAECQVAAGTLGGAWTAVAPPENSWAADPQNDVGVFYITLPPGSKFVLPAARGGKAVNRSAFLVEGPKSGPGAKVEGKAVPGGRAALTLRAEVACAFENDAGAAEAVHVLVLQGRPIGARSVVVCLPVCRRTRAAQPRAGLSSNRATQFTGNQRAVPSLPFLQPATCCASHHHH